MITQLTFIISLDTELLWGCVGHPLSDAINLMKNDDTRLRSFKPRIVCRKILIGLDGEWDYEKISEYAEQFTWENVAKNILEVYKTVLNRRQLDG
jgi:glycosyltransferase involved in cell wall biosynthesis